MGLFGKSTFLEKELEAWSLETWAWLMRALGGGARLKESQLVLASKDFFPPTETDGDERALYLFEWVKKWMGMAEWPCALEAYDRAPANAQVAEFGFVRGPGEPAGTFRVEEGAVIVSYARDQIAQPRVLIATLAHELAHYQVSGALMKGPMPGGMDAHELTTELCVAYNGFAAIAANVAFEFGQHQDAWGQGWRSQRRGYFSERSWAFALAVFLTLKGEGMPTGVLKPSAADLTKAAMRYLSRNPGLLEPLQAIA
jgi:hypothetical protein